MRPNALRRLSNVAKCMPPEPAASSQGIADPWAKALEVATRLHDVDSWLQELADAVEVAVRPDVAAVFLCKLGNMSATAYAVSPRHQTILGRRLSEEFLPGMYRAGLETPCDLFDEPENSHVESITRPFRRDLLQPEGFEALLGRFMRSREGMIAGWITIFSRSAASDRLREIDAPLNALCQAAENALRTIIDFAGVAGARFPKISAAPMSAREAEIANLAAMGLSDMNIAQRLHISEGTVGRHLNNIYRKLGLRSRLELIELLAIGD